MCPVEWSDSPSERGFYGLRADLGEVNDEFCA